MSDTMLYGVLRMPPELWTDSPLDKAQRHSFYVRAAEEHERLRAELAACREEAERYACREDAERYRWLRSVEFHKACDVFFSYQPSSDSLNCFLRNSRTDLDAAIDAARKEQSN